MHQQINKLIGLVINFLTLAFPFPPPSMTELSITFNKLLTRKARDINFIMNTKENEC